MKKKFHKIEGTVIFCICMLMFLCTAAGRPPQRKSRILDYEPKSEIGNIRAFEENTVLFYRSAHGVIPRMDFYTYDVESGEESRVTSLYNGWMLPRLYAVMDSNVYFYLGMEDETVSLVEMDIEKKSCRFLEEGLDIYPLSAYAHALSNNKILLHKGSHDDENETNTIWLDIFDPEQDHIVNVVTSTFAYEGDVLKGEILDLCASFPQDESSWREQQPEADFIALVKRHDEKGQDQLVLRLYLENGEAVKEYNADALLPFRQKTRIYDMRYLGNGYFYFESFNRDGWICRMEEDSLVFVGPEKWDDFSLSVELAATGKNLIQRYYVLYRFGKGEYLCVFDTQDGRFYSVPIQQADKKSGFVFDFPYVDENYNIVMLYRKEADPPAREPNGAIKLLEHYEWTNLEEMLPYATPLDW